VLHVLFQPSFLESCFNSSSSFLLPAVHVVYMASLSFLGLSIQLVEKVWSGCCHSLRNLQALVFCQDSWKWLPAIERSVLMPKCCTLLGIFSLQQTCAQTRFDSSEPLIVSPPTIVMKPALLRGSDCTPPIGYDRPVLRLPTRRSMCNSSSTCNTSVSRTSQSPYFSLTSISAHVR
jgi:hypothetical protein